MKRARQAVVVMLSFVAVVGAFGCGATCTRTALGAFCVALLGLAGLVLAYIRLRAECELEEAERVLRSEMPDLR